MGVTQPEYFVYHSGDEMLEKCEAVDIAFLDVEMPGVSGLHVGTKLKRDNPRVKLFIVTSYADYLDEAMRVQDALKLTDAEISNITRFERGNGLISTNNNHITVEFKASKLEKQLITTDRYELSQILKERS